MKKIILILSILTFTASSCKQVTKQRATAKQAETVNNEVVIGQQVEEEKQSEKKIKYQFKEADYYAEFYENGDYLEDAPSLFKPQSGTYKEYPTHLQLSVNGNNMGNMEFFDDLGHIAKGWQIINYRNVNSSTNTKDFEPAPVNEVNNEYIPAGFYFFNEMYGDLNGDTMDDYVMIIKNKKTNRRGMLIFLDVGHSDETAFENRSCFAPENDGTYLSLDIRDGNLIIHYDDLEQRNVWWQYTVCYRNKNFELTGFDAHNTSPFYESISINFLTKKMLRRNQPNANNDIVKEVWNDIDIQTSLEINKLFKETHLAGFDDLNAKVFSARGWSGIIDIIE